MQLFCLLTLSPVLDGWLAYLPGAHPPYAVRGGRAGPLWDLVMQDISLVQTQPPPSLFV